MTDQDIASRMRYEKRHVAVNGYQMAYVDTGGDADPVVFLHGNVTSSYMWRNIIPHLEPHARCIAPDNIGQGDSDKLRNSGPGSYRLTEHISFIDGFMRALGLDAMRGRVTLVLHDWGGATGLDWARRHTDSLKGIAYFQTIMGDATWGSWPPPVADLFRKFRTPGLGEKLVLEDNVFVEKVFPANVLRDIPAEVWAEYRRPYLTPGEDRRVTLTWPREVPIEGEPADVLAIIEAYMAWLESTDLPKLHIELEDPMVIAGAILERVRALPNQTRRVIAGKHYVHEDHPHAIGKMIADWYRRIG